MTVNIITYVFKHPFEYLSTISMLKKKKKKGKNKTTTKQDFVFQRGKNKNK